MPDFVILSVPSDWPFFNPVVPAYMMPSGNSYIPNLDGQLLVHPIDVGLLLGYGFSIVHLSESGSTNVMIDLDDLSPNQASNLARS